MADPAIGEVRTANGETRRWDGSAWRLATPTPSAAPQSSGPEPSTYAGGFTKGLKDYASELASGTGTARGQVADYGKKEASGFLSTLNPINQVRGLINLPLHPIQSLQGMANTGMQALHGDPEAIGSALGMAIAPKADVGMLRGVNTGANALATSPAARSSLGYIGGAGTALATGMGHPFIGAGIGRAIAPLMKYPAADLASGTGWLLKQLPGATPEAPAVPKPSFKAIDVLRIKQLVDQGVPQDQAVNVVTSLRGQ